MSECPCQSSAGEPTRDNFFFSHATLRFAARVRRDLLCYRIATYPERPRMSLRRKRREAAVFWPFPRGPSRGFLVGQLRQAIIDL